MTIDYNAHEIAQMAQVLHRKFQAKKGYDRLTELIRGSNKKDIIYIK